MKAHVILSLTFTILLAAELPSALAVPVPGTPLGNAFGTIEISGGLTVLPGPVVPGDVVLREIPGGSFDGNNWSDVVRFYNFTYSGVAFGAAFEISDGEAGIPNMTLYGNENTDIILPNTPSANVQFLTEIQQGTGTDADVTPYIPLAGTLYNIHSDSVFPSDTNDVTIGIGGQIDIGKGNRVITIDEGTADFAQLRVAGVYTPGFLTAADGGDTLIVAADPADPTGHTFLTLFSNADDNDSPPEGEYITAQGDEVYTSFLILSVDVPEPSTLLLMGTGLVGLMGCVSRRRKPTVSCGPTKISRAGHQRRPRT